MDNDQQPAHDDEQDELAPKRSMRDRRRKSAPPAPSTHDGTDEPGADAEADQRAIEEEFWNKK